MHGRPLPAAIPFDVLTYVALYDAEGAEIMATMQVTEKFEMTEADKIFECEKCYMGEGTPTAEEFWKIAKDDHPGVQMVMDQKAFNLAGPVKVLSEAEYPTKYADVYARPAESRKMFEDRGWSDVAALQLTQSTADGGTDTASRTGEAAILVLS